MVGCGKDGGEGLFLCIGWKCVVDVNEMQDRMLKTKIKGFVGG